MNFSGIESVEDARTDHLDRARTVIRGRFIRSTKTMKHGAVTPYTPRITSQNYPRELHDNTESLSLSPLPHRKHYTTAPRDIVIRTMNERFITSQTIRKLVF